MATDLTSVGGSGERGSSGQGGGAGGFGVRDILAGLGVALVLIPQSLTRPPWCRHCPGGLC